MHVAELSRYATSTIVSGVVTALALTSGKFWTYELEKETSSLTETITTNDVNGTVYYDQELDFSIRKMQASISQEIRLLAQNRLMIISKDRNGKYWITGFNNGMEMQTSTGASGKAFGDMNGYSLKFKGKEENPMYEVSASIIAALIA